MPTDDLRAAEDDTAPGARFERMATAVRDLSAARTHGDIVDIVRHAAREVVGAFGVSVVLREGGECHYIAEDSEVPLWSGLRFPLGDCVSGWTMLNRQPAVIPDIYGDDRVPHDAYRSTGIHSLVMCPVGEPEPFGALGAYWREVRQPSEAEVAAIRALASCMANSLHNMDLVESLRDEVRRAAEREADRDAANARIRFQASLLEAVGEAVIATDLDGRVTFWNTAAEALYGWPADQAIGRQILELTPAAGSREESGEIMAALQAGESWAGETRLRRRDGSEFPALVTDTPIHDADGRLVGVVGVSRDLTDRRRAEEHKQLLIHELNHRVKNTLAIVQSMAAQTLRDDRAYGSAREDFDSRLMALAGAHVLMTEAEWRAVDVDDLLRRAIAPFTGGLDGRFEIAGPEVRLPPKTAVAFTLAVHELCTNASKYGALSIPAGRVEIGWTVTPSDGRERLRLTWREVGGPPVTPPARRGFGSRLLERGLAAELHGEVTLEFHPAGLVCVMDVAVPEINDPPPEPLFPVPG